jgi:hypothetical protein
MSDSAAHQSPAPGLGIEPEIAAQMAHTLLDAAQAETAFLPCVESFSIVRNGKRDSVLPLADGDTHAPRSRVALGVV